MGTVFLNSSVEVTTRDTIVSIVSNMPAEIGLSSEFISSLDSLKNQLFLSNTKIDSIFNLLQQTSTYDWGLEQIVSLIIIPLIIAIFAFTLPLISSAISKVESIYQCDAIGKKLECSWQMISYWILLALCMLMLLLITIMPSTMTIVIKILPYVTSFLVLSVFNFFYTVRNFAKPYWVVSQLDKWYNFAFNTTIRRLKFKEIIIRIKKSLKRDSYAKVVYDRMLSLNKSNPHSVADKNFYKQLYALLQLAVNTKDTMLLYTIKDSWYNRISKTKERSLQQPNNTLSYFYYSDDLFLFHEKTIAFLGQHNEPEYQELAIDMLRMTLNHGQFPQEYNIGGIIRALIVPQGLKGTNLIKKYFVQLNRMYKDFCSIPTIAYVCGEDIERKKDIEYEYIRKWDWICDIHFMLAAYVWNRGKYEISNDTCPAKDRAVNDVLPISCVDVIYRYLSCRRNNSSISEWEVNTIFDVSMDEIQEMLVKYTIFLMYFTASREKILYQNLTDVSILQDIDTKIIDDLKDDKYKKKVDDLCELIQHKTSNLDLKNVIDETIKVIREELSAMECKSGIDQNTVSKMQQLLMHTRAQIRSSHFDKLYRNEDIIGAETMKLNTCSIKMNKSVFTQQDIDVQILNRIATSVNRIIDNRSIYAWLFAINQMQIKVVECSAVNFAETIIQHTKGELDKYVIVNFESPFSSIMPQYFRINGIHKIDSYNYSLCYKTNLFAENNKCIFIVRKDDVPSLHYEAEYENSHCVVQNESTQNQTDIYVRLELNPHLILQYSKSAKVLKIKHKRIGF